MHNIQGMTIVKFISKFSNVELKDANLLTGFSDVVACVTVPSQDISGSLIQSEAI